MHLTNLLLLTLILIIVYDFFKLLFLISDKVIDNPKIIIQVVLKTFKTFLKLYKPIKSISVFLIINLHKKLRIVSIYLKDLQRYILTKTKQHQTIYLFLVIFLSTIMNFFIAFSFEGTGDYGGWNTGARTGLEKADLGMGNGTVYDKDCSLLCVNWPPLTYHYLMLMRWLYLNANPLGLAELGVYSVLPILSGIGITLFIYFYVKKNRSGNPLFLSLLYAFSPISIYITAYHGQRDSVWIFLTMLAIYFISKKRVLVSALFFGLGVSFKIPGLLLFPLVFFYLQGFYKKFLFTFLTFATVYFLNLPEIYTHSQEVINQVFLYRGHANWWGLSGIISKILIFIDIPQSANISSLLKLNLYLFLIYFSYRLAKNKDLFNSCLTLIILVMVLSPVFGYQYLLYPLSFMILLYKKYESFVWLYIILGTYLTINFYASIFGVQLLEKVFLSIPQKLVFYKIPHFIYPLDLGFIIWILCIFFAYRLFFKNESHR
ncbi:hypothetical protein A2631_02870 [Candidatus Daviesbacteria bacterium RIFCSPHIGHO2_01_FULL_44_29]|uniref:Glycosyltransferase RgtA/B/C/D-like domain-containing protein n=1 Tax=Candidatus Daviesbacteria bacterium RIFCSPHIGHO2_02_FULL_43_12 TaxID=1797776 RepID=A0A1F5KK63_9BACT|nr:MAG: hypothetical protein A2631_02870 [Candidatus Daviesbacteria bacterium RIFCSPHIGHO2_01_FULL_44_29]OGE40821.1 MAG: hypothetical protein A3E86_02480 [Candidatus Daviesbacteria bacterium RIFCSPHIGHO2_12_FULL_47_45]OGE41326.1 MAG: hypothetical protein A3D25_02265 [Candidatus Daviesbacteria bacterium RIFCSPHIGHO2_02_FULL_43_12]OGE69527.1 MAG: hypothetical protein A3B55_04005 [Candidatus Daviesbacteria bacterium RIFCSPLOWO2_01_FULL_43_15]